MSASTSPGRFTVLILAGSTLAIESGAPYVDYPRFAIINLYITIYDKIN